MLLIVITLRHIAQFIPLVRFFIASPHHIANKRYVRGSGNWNDGQFQAVISDLTAALRYVGGSDFVAPDGHVVGRDQAYTYRGYSYAALGERNRAEQDLEMAVRLASNDATREIMEQRLQELRAGGLPQPVKDKLGSRV